jgi:streptomycin 6-kinase
MKIISETISKRKRGGRIPPAPRIDSKKPELTGRQLIQWLKAQGAIPVDAATKRRLIASGNWGMPEE